MATIGARRSGLVSGWRLILWSVIAALLVLPLIAMQFTREVAWTASDFAFAAVLLGGAGAAFEVAVRLTARTGLRVAVGAAIVAIVGLIWAQAAVGFV